MPFVPGTPKPENSGRRKGVTNKLSREVAARLEELGCDPIKGMVLIARAKDTSPELRGRMYSELAQYVWPKRKSVEHTGIGVTVSGEEDADLRRTLLEAIKELPDEHRQRIAAALMARSTDKPDGLVQ